MHVHTVAGHLIKRLRHESHAEPPLRRDLLDNPLRERNHIRRARHIHKVELYLELRHGDLVMMILHGNAENLHQMHRLVAEIRIAVLRRKPVIGGVQADARLVVAALAETLGGLHAVESLIHARLVLRLLKDVILKLHEHLRGIGDALLAQEIARRAHDVARVLAEGLALRRNHVAEDVQNPVIAADFIESRLHIRHGHHVGIVDLRVSVVRGVEADPVREDLVRNIAARQRDAADIPRYVHHEHAEEIRIFNMAVVTFELHRNPSKRFCVAEPL